MTAEAHETPGLDLAVLRDYLDRERPGLVDGDLRAEIIAGGRSNLTYDVSDGRSSWVVRRPPLGHVLATAHDMTREHRVISALEPTDVPVPRTIVLCEDPDVLGAPFYVMEKVGGIPYRRAAQLQRIGAERTRDICLRMVDILATLHRIDPADVGLGDFGRPEGYLARQVERWRAHLASYDQLDGYDGPDIPGVEEVAAWLDAHRPPEAPPGIIHGDFHLANVLFRHDAPGYGYVDEQTPELSIAVVPSRRGRGFGDELLRALMDRARLEGYTALSLSVERENPALKLYERFGFRPVEERGDTLVMKADLHDHAASA